MFGPTGVELFNPRDGRSAASKPLFSGARGITGILPGGESWSIGPTSRGLQMSLGARLFSLTPLPAAEFGVRVEELQSSQFGNAASVRTDNGTWSLAESTLHLRFARAGATRYSLQRVADDVVALDGRRYAVERSSRCR